MIASRARLPALDELLDEGQHHQPVEHGNAGQRDEAHRGRDRERHAAQPERDDASRQRERHRAEHQQRVARGAQRREQDQKDHHKAGGHHDGQALPRRGEVLELSSPGDPVSGRQLYALRNLLLGFAHHRADVPAAHVRRHHDAALSVFAADLVGPLRERQRGHVAQGNRHARRRPALARQRHRKAEDHVGIGAQRVRQAGPRSGNGGRLRTPARPPARRSRYRSRPERRQCSSPAAISPSCRCRFRRTAAPSPARP